MGDYPRRMVGVGLDSLCVQRTLNTVMASKTITVTESTYKLLRDWKEENESFSEMLTREFEGKFSAQQVLREWDEMNAKKGINPFAQRADSPYRRKK